MAKIFMYEGDKFNNSISNGIKTSDMNNLSVSLNHSGIGGSLGGNLINHLCRGIICG